MKVFLSWSGERSKAVAVLLSDWIKCVLQATRPWISTRDIDRGALWFTEISDQLRETTVGIVCLTQENKNKPWILFEAGALAKGLSSNRVCTFLVDLKPTDLEDPLAQFNHTMIDRPSMWELVRTLNGCLGANGLDERILEQVFATYWDGFDKKFKEILKETPLTQKPEPRTEKNLLGEILENTRLLNSRIRRLESRIDVDIPTISELEADSRNQIGYSPTGALRVKVKTMLDTGHTANEIIESLMQTTGFSPESIRRRIAEVKHMSANRMGPTTAT